MKNFLLLSVLLLLLSCKFPTNDINLGNGYVIDQENEKNLMLLKSVNKNESYELVLPGTIISYSYDKFFIILLRDATEYSYNNCPDKKLWKDIEGDKYQFWIIDKTISNKYGPLNLSEYIEMRSKLNISSEAILEI